MHLDLLSNLKILYKLDEGFEGWGKWLLQLFLGFPLVECFDLRALFDRRSEGESLLLPIDVELNFSSSHINVCICRTQEWPSQTERSLGVEFHVKNDKINRDEEIPYFHENILGNSRRVTNRLVH
jgi:hypothetical protein